MEHGRSFVRLSVCLSCLLLIWLDFTQATCYRKPQGATGDRSPVDENYQILIDGNPSSYIPGQQYNISISCANGLNFISFTLLVEADTNATGRTASVQAAGDDGILGRFEIIDNAETKFSTLCENMIESSNTNAKNRIDVAWVAPSESQSGCVLFKAAILQHRNVWFIDDGFLTKRLCPEEIDEINSQTPPVNPCCACDDAKYEIILERRWQRNTHAKDFPSEPWRTKLGEVIGASHSLDFRFWEYGGRASQGLQELAEHGATQTLENEIKNQTLSGSIRTIIKAPGIKYRLNIIGKTLATARVGPVHHVISLVLKIDPSPDWILGVSGLELCLSNCTWIDKKVLNLYPWDIGTDAGPSYMSPDQAQYPPDVIRRITSTFPSDYRSPFFDKTGAPMKPLATLHVNRKRTYERECDYEKPSALECSTHPWSNFTECSVKCGTGMHYSQRSYKDPKVAENFNCNEYLTKTETCEGNQCENQQTESRSAACELSDWSAWSKCSKECGDGYQSRRKYYKNPYARKECEAGNKIPLTETQACKGEICGGNIPNSFYGRNNNNNNMYNQNFDEQNSFKHTNFVGKSYGNGQQQQQQQPKWGVTETEGDQTNYDATNNNMNPDYDDRAQIPPYSFNNNENEEDVNENASNIHGNEKLVGRHMNSWLPYEQAETGNPNLFGNLEDKNFDPDKKRPGFHKSPNTFHNSRNPSGFSNIDSEQMTAQQSNSFCFQKPVASRKRCTKKHPIVKNYWFYDADDGACKLFTADNCDENRNKFLSMEKCEEVCSQSLQPPENDDTRAVNRGRYNSRSFEMRQQQQPPLRPLWN